MKKVHLKICCGMNCLTHGAQEILDLLEAEPKYQSDVEFEAVECLNTCGDKGYLSPVIELEGAVYSQMTPERVMELLDQHLGQ